MSNDGENILNSVKQMKNIFKDVSRLLETVDGLMEKEEWIPAWKQRNLSILESSNSLINPDRWMPSEIFRFYKKKDIPKLSFASVLLDDDLDENYTISEPLITAGYFDLGDKKVDYPDYGWPRIYGFAKNEEDNGTITPFKGGIELAKDRKYNFPFESGEGFGWPLTSIKNTEDIQNKIIIPLIKLLKEK